MIDVVLGILGYKKGMNAEEAIRTAFITGIGLWIFSLIIGFLGTVTNTAVAISPAWSVVSSSTTVSSPIVGSITALFDFVIGVILGIVLGYVLESVRESIA